MRYVKDYDFEQSLVSVWLDLRTKDSADALTKDGRALLERIQRHPAITHRVSLLAFAHNQLDYQM